MTREEYMKQLEESLRGYSREFAEDILDNYREHFETGLRDGRTEEEICEELGGIENLLKDIQEMMGDRDIRAHELEQYTAVVEHQEQYSGVNKVELSLASIDVKLSASADNQLHVYLEDGKDKGKYLEERMSGDSYYAYERKLERDQSRGLLAQLMNIGRGMEDLCLVVEVPERLESLTIKTSSGDLELHDFWSRALSLETSSGDVEAERFGCEEMISKSTSGDQKIGRLKARDLLLKTGSGDIELRDIEGEPLHEGQLSSISGDLEVSAVRANSLNLQTTSGDMGLRGVSAKQLSLKSTSGDSSLRDVEAGYLESQSTSGDLRGGLFAANIRGSSVSGDIVLTLDRRGRTLVVTKSRSVSGSCQVSGVDAWDGSANPDNSIMAEFSTVSGDIKVK